MFPAVASGIAVLTTKLLPMLGLLFLPVGAWLGFRDQPPEIDRTALIILFGGAVTLGAFVVRRRSKPRNRHLDYLRTLTQTLYLRTLAAGPGVLHSLLWPAGNQEVAESTSTSMGCSPRSDPFPGPKPTVHRIGLAQLEAAQIDPATNTADSNATPARAAHSGSLAFTTAM